MSVKKPNVELLKPIKPMNWLNLMSELSKRINLVSENISGTLEALMERLAVEMHIDAIAIWAIEPETNFMFIHSSIGLSDVNDSAIVRRT